MTMKQVQVQVGNEDFSSLTIVSHRALTMDHTTTAGR